jgi:NhaP-type Na+/H+ or K+/H+ antiporter
VKAQGHPIIGAINGFFLGVFLAADLLFFGAIQLDSELTVILPLVGIVVGIALGFWGPLKRERA